MLPSPNIWSTFRLRPNSGEVSTTIPTAPTAPTIPTARKCWLEQRPDGGNPIVRFKRDGGGFRTILSFDGGAMRCLVTVMLLKNLETTIKEHLKATNCKVFKSSDPDSEEEPDFFEKKTTDDFDILLGDYFDYVAGVSMGSAIAAYIATYGKGSDKMFENASLKNGLAEECKKVAEGKESKKLATLADSEVAMNAWKDSASQSCLQTDYADDNGTNAMNEEKFIKDAKELLPSGSMKRLEAAFIFCASEMFLSYPELDKDPKTQDDFTNRMRQLGNSNKSDGNGKFMELLFDDAKASDLQKTLMILSFDLTKSKPIGFVTVGQATTTDEDKKGEVQVKELPIDNEDAGWHIDYDLVRLPDGRPASIQNGVLERILNKAENGVTVGELPGGETLLCDLTKASAAVPGVFNPVELKVAGRDLQLIDGATFSNDPAFLATIFYPIENSEEQKPAILSIGSGLCTPYEVNSIGNVPEDNLEGNPGNDFAQHFIALIYTFLMDTGAEVTSRALASKMRREYSQFPKAYCRIQFSPKSNDGALALEDPMTCYHIDELLELGEKVVEVKAQQMSQFVEKFVFETPEHSKNRVPYDEYMV